MKSISQKLQDDIRAIMEAGLHPNQQRIDVHEPEKDKITADDFKKLRAMKKTKDGKVHNCATHVEHVVLGKGTTVSEQHAEPDANGDIEWYTVQFENSVQKVLTKDLTITMSEAHVHESAEEQVNEEADQSVANVAGHKVTLHRSLSEPGTSDTYTLHHPSGDKKVKISFNKHGDGDEVHGEKVNKAFGLDSKHKLGHKIANSMNGMGGISKFEESYSHQVDEEEKKKVVSPFDWKNRPSELAKKPGELTGHDSKKISTGTVYTRKPVKEAMSDQAKTTMKHIPNASPALKKAAKDIKPGVAGYRDRIDMLKAGGVKEDVEQKEYTFAEYLDAARARYVDEDAVLVANEAFKNKDITLFSDQSQSPEA
jgi:hypothetical protein